MVRIENINQKIVSKLAPSVVVSVGCSIHSMKSILVQYWYFNSVPAHTKYSMMDLHGTGYNLY